MERLSLCLKNLERHGWRTRIILLISMLGAFLAFVSENLIEDISRKQSDMFGRAIAGHFRIVDSRIEMAGTFGFYSYEPDEMLSPSEIASVKTFLAGLPGVTGSRECIFFNGLFYGSNDTERGFSAIAMDMESYNRDFTDLYYARGEMLKAGDADACAATWYDYERDKTLDVGSSYVFLLPNREGEFVDRKIKVKGGIDYHSMPRENVGFNGLYFDLDGFRKAVGYQEALASEVVGFLADARAEAKVLPRIAAFLAREHPNLKVVSWSEYSPVISEIVTGFDAMMKGVDAILVVICVLLVVKLTTFSIIERYSEIGTMRALGFTRSDITLQFALEGFLIIASGALAGFALGAGLITVLHATGVSNSIDVLAYLIGYGFRPQLHWDKIAAVAAVFMAIAALAPLFPAMRGGRLSILRTLEKR
jgi:hypothetical protein